MLQLIIAILQLRNNSRVMRFLITMACNKQTQIWTQAQTQININSLSKIFNKQTIDNMVNNSLCQLQLINSNNNNLQVTNPLKISNFNKIIKRTSIHPIVHQIINLQLPYSNNN